MSATTLEELGLPNVTSFAVVAAVVGASPLFPQHPQILPKRQPTFNTSLQLHAVDVLHRSSKEGRIRLPSASDNNNINDDDDDDDDDDDERRRQ